MPSLSQYVTISPETLNKIIWTLFVVVLLTISRSVAILVIRRQTEDAMKRYHARRAVMYIYGLLVLVLIGAIWTRGLVSLVSFLGLVSAGVAIAMHDTIANVAGWLFILARRPFKVGDRIEIDGISGDVIDVRVFQFSLVEIGNWVDAEQSTGRIVHVPNSLVLREPLANYHIGFEYIWNEIPVLITFESDWKKAKQLLRRIARQYAEHLSAGAQEQLRRAASKYMIFYGALTPTVYTSVKESGVLLTVRYMVAPRQRRSSAEHIWEAILDEFAADPTIELAYPTTRFYTAPAHDPHP